MDIIVCHPFLQSTGGGDRVVLEIAKRFNPTIYSVVYDKEGSFPELKEFNIQLLPPSKLELPFAALQSDPRRFNAVSAGFRYYFKKFKEDYDAICAMGCPSEWIRSRNGRVSWYCFSPNREAFDLKEFRMAEMSPKRQLLNHFLLGTYQLAEYTVVPKIETIMTSSPVVQKRIDHYLWRDDAVVVAPGVDCKEFTNEGYGKFFFYPSRIVPEKRFELAISAFREFSKTHPDWKLVIGGFLSQLQRDRHYYMRLKDMAFGLNVEFKINLTEAELKKLYATCHAVLFCGIDEDFGLIPLEAMASEKPIISINEGGPRYTIKDGETGFLVPSNGFLPAMTALAGNMAWTEAMGKAGRKHVMEEYTWEKFLDGVERELKNAAEAD